MNGIKYILSQSHKNKKIVNINKLNIFNIYICMYKRKNKLNTIYNAVFHFKSIQITLPMSMFISHRYLYKLTITLRGKAIYQSPP